MLRSHQSIELRTDSPEWAERVAALLEKHGFQRPRVVTDRVQPSPRNTVCGGGLRAADFAALVTLIQKSLTESGVNLDNHPLEYARASEELCVITASIAACFERKRLPYAGDYWTRFEVQLFCDDQEDGKALQWALMKEGYRVRRHLVSRDMKGFTLFHPREAGPLVAPIRHYLERAVVQATGDPEGLTISVVPRDRDHITIFAPLRAAHDAAVQKSAREPGDRRICIFSPDEHLGGLVRAALCEAGFAEPELFADVGKGAAICVGGAPPLVCSRLRDIVKRVFEGATFKIERLWPLCSREVHIHLPQPRSKAAKPSAGGAFLRPQAVPFVRTLGNEVFVGERAVVKRDGCSLPAGTSKRFVDFCIDKTTASSLAFIAASIDTRESLMLEGATGVSKTAVVEYFAHLLGQKVYRVNLHGHSDHSELTGRYVPEGQSFAFVEQALPRAMREGAILLLDEVNLAESAVVERINSALDVPPMLRLTEADSREIAGDDVSSDFQVVATANPVNEYVGRSEHSLAFLNRFVFRHVPKPSEHDLKDLMHFLATGEQPAIEVDGVNYAIHQVAAPMPALGYLPQREQAFEALARFHVGAEQCIGQSDGGPRVRRSISRRQLISVMRAMNRDPGTDAGQWAERLWLAVRRYYFAIVAPWPEAHRSMIDLFQASGFGAERWSLRA
jgi:AAA domain (dynein-related subfamily)